MKKLLFAMLCLAPLSLQAANTVTNVEQVSSAVTVAGEQDYVISSATPFTGSGSVDITGLEHAVVILKNVIPSKTISSWLSGHVYINGAQAVDGENCQVKMYAQGAIIMPYEKNYKPLTVYSEQNFEGTSVNDFGLENSNGFMNTLSAAKLNNKIRSFKLKRGYMVTFSTRKEGRGYSRCFIADNEDLEISELPAILDQSISSYRVFQWYNAQKKGLASDTGAGNNAALGSSWCYSWGTGESRLPDAECVPNHIYEDWPSASACGSVTYSCHMKTNNEPGNSADDHPQDVATVLANWENLMRTGMRLCSESSHDGSMGHLKEFIDSIDARGWRCDILDLHCYWPSGTFNNLTWYSDHYGNGRPIWISEWVWGASWNNNGAFNVSNRNDYEGNWDNTYNGTKPILDVINGNSRVERYAYWNSEANCSKLILNGKLSKLGEYYANMESGLGYNPANEYIPRTPPMSAPRNLVATFDKHLQQVNLKWNEYNGEYNKSMEIQLYNEVADSWSRVQVVDLQEEAAEYSVDVPGVDGNIYRIRLVDGNGSVRFTNEAQAVNENLKFGDAVSLSTETGKKTLYAGGNRLLNGDFLLGTYDWTTGAGTSLEYPYFQVVPEGGLNNSPYLQCYGSNNDAKHAQSIRKVVQLKPGSSYYVQIGGSHNNPSSQRISTSTNTTNETNIRLKTMNLNEWNVQGTSFTVAQDTMLIFTLRNLAGKAQFDDVRVVALFETEAEAMADALVWEKKRVEAYLAQQEGKEEYTRTLSELLSGNATANQLEQALQASWKAIKQAEEEAAAAAIVSEYEKNLPFAADADHYLLVTDALQSFDFSTISGWNTAAGTYQGGTQRNNTLGGQTCWQAVWSLAPQAGEVPTMAIWQTTGQLSHGLYAAEALATTYHLCETDQHLWMRNNVTGDSLVSVPLNIGRLDLPGYDNADRWSHLTTSYTYVNEKGTLDVGFVGSKQSTDVGRYMPYNDASATPDNREGSWCATQFKLRRIPLLLRATDAGGWGTLCLPDSVVVPEGIQLYSLAGILADGSAIGLTPVETAVPGMPYVYHTDKPEVELTFLEYGPEEQYVNDDTNGLYGVFGASVALRYPKNSLRVVNGAFTLVTESGIPVESFSAFIYKQNQVPVLDSFEGITLAVVDPATGIDQLEETSQPAPRYYNLQGMRIVRPQGIFVSEGKIVVTK